MNLSLRLFAFSVPMTMMLVLVSRTNIVPPISLASASEASMQASATNAQAPLPCPVTIANGSTPPGERPSPEHHGNAALWTALWPEGKVLATPAYVRYDGSINMKFPWWRGPGVVGALSIEGRRLDGPAPPLQAQIPEGYSDEGFQASGIIFPTEGCWEITGKANGASLTFVTLVIKVEAPSTPTTTTNASENGTASPVASIAPIQSALETPVPKGMPRTGQRDWAAFITFVVTVLVGLVLLSIGLLLLKRGGKAKGAT